MPDHEPPPRTGAPALAALLHVPGRADARRNYESLLGAATEVFAEYGPDASLDEIARRAGVGNATLYRHFPGRHDLLVAVCIGEVEALCTRARRLSGTHPPGDALLAWLRSFVEHVTSKQGLAAALMTGRREDSEVISACNGAIAATAGVLLRDAQSAGTVRPDLGVEELLKLVNAVAMAGESDSGAEAGRMLELVLDGLRSR